MEAAGIDNPLRRLPELGPIEELIADVYTSLDRRRLPDPNGNRPAITIPDIEAAFRIRGVDDRDLIQETWDLAVLLDRRAEELKAERRAAEEQAAQQQEANSRCQPST